MLQHWSFAKVALVSGGWVVAWLLVALAWVIPGWSAFNRSSGSGGTSTVSFGIDPFTLAIPFGPPILLVAAWLIVRWRGTSRIG